jgi:phosphocarrier protein HPr
MRVQEISIKQDLDSHYMQSVAHKANQFRSDIFLVLDDDSRELDVKSLLGMMLLFLKKHTAVTLKVKGDDEEEALETIGSMLE